MLCPQSCVGDADVSYVQIWLSINLSQITSFRPMSKHED